MSLWSSAILFFYPGGVLYPLCVRELAQLVACYCIMQILRLEIIFYHPILFNTYCCLFVG